jgi:hypothetical protein
MRGGGTTLTRALALLAIALLLLPAPAAAQTGCAFRSGFKAIADQIPGIVGACLSEEHDAGDGTARQLATGGYFVWRAADDSTTFISAGGTWRLGPGGPEGPIDVGAGNPAPWTAAIDVVRGACPADVASLLAIAGAYGVAPSNLAAARAGGERFCQDASLRDGERGYQCYRVVYRRAILRSQGTTAAASTVSRDVETDEAGCVGD